jgi:hypothetical protein
MCPQAPRPVFCICCRGKHGLSATSTASYTEDTQADLRLAVGDPACLLTLLEHCAISLELRYTAQSDHHKFLSREQSTDPSTGPSDWAMCLPRLFHEVDLPTKEWAKEPEAGQVHTPESSTAGKTWLPRRCTCSRHTETHTMHTRQRCTHTCVI